MKILIAITVLMINYTSYTQIYKDHIDSLYKECNLEAKLSKLIFHKAVTGFYNLKYEGKVTGNRIAIVDFRQSSSDPRLYVIDLQDKVLMFRCKVAHGIKSGKRYAIQFSNTKNSWQSSLGFFKTSEMYKGINGISLRLDGLDGDYNDNARIRNIVVHGADYIDSLHVGYSKGCIAVPHDIAYEIINAIKNGNCLFVYTHTYKGQIATMRLNESLAEKYYNKLKSANELLDLINNINGYEKDL